MDKKEKLMELLTAGVPAKEIREMGYKSHEIKRARKKLPKTIEKPRDIPLCKHCGNILYKGTWEWSGTEMYFDRIDEYDYNISYCPDCEDFICCGEPMAPVLQDKRCMDRIECLICGNEKHA